MYKYILFFYLLFMPVFGSGINGNGSPGTAVQSWPFNGTIISSSTPRVISGGAVTSPTYNYRVWTETAGTITYYDQQLLINYAPNYPSISFAYSSSNTGVGTVNSSGKVTQQSNGSTIITATSQYPPLKLNLTLNLASSGNPYTDVFQNWASGTLGASINNGIDTLATNASPGTTLNIFSYADDTKFIYTRNSSVWTGAGVDLTGVVASHSVNNGNTQIGGGALITPQDIICAAHIYYVSGVTLNFVDGSNNVYSSVTGSGSQISGTDIYIVHLNTALPSSIKYYKIIPSNYASHTGDSNLNCFPILLTYCFGHICYILDSFNFSVLNYGSSVTFSGNTISPGFGVTGNEVRYNSATETNRTPYTTNVTSGSGSPGFVLINGEPILIGCLHTTATFSWTGDYGSAINSALVSLGSGSTINVSSASTSSAAVTLASSTLPYGFGVGSILLGSAVVSVSGTSVTLTSNSNANVASSTSESFNYQVSYSNLSGFTP